MSTPGLAQSAAKKRDDFKKFQTQYRKTIEDFSIAIHKIAKERDESGDQKAAAEIRQIAFPVDPTQLRGRKLPREVQPKLAESLSPEEKGWRTQLRELRATHATTLYRLARQAAQKRFVSFAFDLIHETLHHDPDHAGARRILGDRRIDQEWLTAFSAEMRRKKYRWNDTYGWLPIEHVARYENGERNYQGRWMPAEQEQKIRSNFRDAWYIRTDHFEIRTNHSLEGGVALARELEDFHTAFFATFAASFTPPEQLNKLIEGGTLPSTPPRPHRIHYYRTREEYLDTCQKKMPHDIKITLGLYIPSDQISYFFHPTDPDANVRTTVIHEATHQLFSETRPSRQPIGIHSDFWIIEGIACYMESFVSTEEGFSLGDPAYKRFENARYRLLGPQPYFVPLAEFTAMGQAEFQNSPNIQPNYSQGSGLTHFFMHFQEGLYRDDLVEYLSDVYSNTSRVREHPRSLEELTEVPFRELDRQYTDYLKEQELALREKIQKTPQPESGEAASAGPGENP